MMGTRRITAALVAAALVLGGGMAGSPASAATIPPQCAKQANAVSSAKKSLARAKKIRGKAKRTKAVRAATKKLSAKKKALTACVKREAPAPPAPPAPAPPAPPISVAPATPRISEPFVVSMAQRNPAPAGYHYKIYALQRNSSSSGSCGRFAFEDLSASGAAQSVTFSPQGAKLPLGGSAIWCAGSWTASVNLVSDTASEVGQIIDFANFTIQFSR